MNKEALPIDNARACNPGLKVITSVLSIKVKEIKGPIVNEELPTCKEFGNKIAIQVKILRRT
jgi:hypothetical protein